MSTVRADAVVIGAGVMGCSIALALAREGRAVQVVDRAGAAGQGSTSASSNGTMACAVPRTSTALRFPIL